MDTERFRPPAWQLQMLNQVVQDTQKCGFLSLATQHAKQMNAIATQMQSPIVTALANLNPLLPVIKTAQETMKQMAEPIKQATEVMAKIGQQLNTVTSVVETYRKMQKAARAWIVQVIKSAWSGLTEAALNVGEWFEQVRKRIHRYQILKRARDGDREAYYQIPELFPIQLRHYKQLHKGNWQVEDFINLVLMKFMELLNKFQKLENQAIDVLFEFLEKLFFSLVDFFRGEAKKHHLERINQVGLTQAAIIIENERYVLIPSLSQEVNIPESTLRRWVKQGLLPAKKLLYINLTGYTRPTWHIPLTKDMFVRLQELKSLPERKNKLAVLGYMNRQEAAQASGLSESTLKLWEKKGLITPERQGKRVLYNQTHFEQLAALRVPTQSHTLPTPALSYAS